MVSIYCVLLPGHNPKSNIKKKAVYTFIKLKSLYQVPYLPIFHLFYIQTWDFIFIIYYSYFFYERVERVPQSLICLYFQLFYIQIWDYIFIIYCCYLFYERVERVPQSLNCLYSNFYIYKYIYFYYL